MGPEILRPSVLPAGEPSGHFLECPRYEAAHSCCNRGRLRRPSCSRVPSCSSDAPQARSGRRGLREAPQRGAGRHGRVPGRLAARPPPAHRPGPLPELRRARVRRHVVPQRLLRLRLDHEGGAADPRRHAPAARARRPTAATTPTRSTTSSPATATASSTRRRRRRSARRRSARARAGRGRRSSRTCSAAGRSASTAGCARSRPASRRCGSSTCCCRTAPTSTSRRVSGRGRGRPTRCTG